VSRASPFVVTLSESDRAALEQQARSSTAPHAEVIRAKIVLFAAGGQANAAIAKRLDAHVDVVSRWRGSLGRPESNWFMRTAPNTVSEPTQSPSTNIGRYTLMGDLNPFDGFRAPATGC